MSAKCKQQVDAAMLGAVIGAANLARWTRIKHKLQQKNDQEFVHLLLDLASKYLLKNNKQKCKSKHLMHENKDIDKDRDKSIINGGNRLRRKEHKYKKWKMLSNKVLNNVNQVETAREKTVPLKPSLMVNISNELLAPLSVMQAKNTKVLLIEDIVKTKPTIKQENEIRDPKKVSETDSETKIVSNTLKPVTNSLSNIVNTNNTKDNSEKDKNCPLCQTQHTECPFMHPTHCINDIDKLPTCLRLNESTDLMTEHGPSIFAEDAIASYTQFGPLRAPLVKEVDVPEDCNMRYIYEAPTSETTRVYFNAENAAASNWPRHLRPAPTRDARNLAVVVKDNALYFVTSRPVSVGDELLYWQDDLGGGGTAGKKKMEKTTCGGCNMTFAHPLYYRVHCSLFHDVRYSLTIRKYHCKVCGAAVLGKENIMKHASELHNGQGAYQCQFCKKFFLRLNYLEMHRTYGCSANPHRSRPLCDFCGRKFCQPQKLKVHIKRMHSDMSEVLKEFQCKNCMKILGSRAALQRHFKEVHQKQVEGACACSKCGKKFQNKSNLKIHMLTHSGIKPFKCNQSTCAAAFTTKQCLQFHYKKLHGFNEENLPKIERSVDYTFEAYAGGDQDNPPDADDEQIDDDNEEAEVEAETEMGAEMEVIASPEVPNVKVLSKGSKKWIEEDFTTTTTTTSTGTTTLHESNASLLVEAALDSVCSEHEANIEIDVNVSPTCGNLYTLSDAYSQSVDEPISVTDEDLRQSANIGIDYSSFHHEDFSPAASPRNNFREYMSVNATQPRYDFGSAINVPIGQESDDSSGIGVQNLSLHAGEQPRDVQLDLSIYKSYKLAADDDARNNYLISEDTNKFSLNGNVDNDHLADELKDFDDGIDDKSDIDVERSKFDLDLDLRRTYDASIDDFRIKSYDLDNLRDTLERKTYESLIDDFRTDGRGFEPLVLNPPELQGLDMSARGYHNYPNLNRYHHLYGEVERSTVDLRLGPPPYSPPPPSYTHPDILRVSHSVDLSLRSQIANSRLLGVADLAPTSRLISDMSNRILTVSDHTTNRLISNEPRILQQVQEDARLLGPATGSMSPVSYSGYAVSPSPYHPTALPPRPHVASPNATAYHHYSAYY